MRLTETAHLRSHTQNRQLRIELPWWRTGWRIRIKPTSHKNTVDSPWELRPTIMRHQQEARAPLLDLVSAKQQLQSVPSAATTNITYNTINTPHEPERSGLKS
ncbi:hypothetical protein J6590_080533 [Homalodisca vitripennis]|nr:hypothetical protein J6590_080533 [Homalodisca vitripennis]